MSASQGVNVLRWSALVFGVFYGFTHQRTITAQNHAQHAHAEYKHREQLIQKAKAEWAKKQSPQSAQAGGDNVITDPDDKNFDLEAYLTKVAAES